MANFSRRAYRFDFSELRSYVFKSLGALLRLHGVVVALSWLIKPPSRFFPPLFRRDVYKIFFIVFLVRLSRITKLVLKAKIDEQLVFYLFAGRRKKFSQPFLFQFMITHFLFLTEESLKRSALSLEQWREFILKVIFHLLFLGLGINNWGL